jgi:hypothetical protein
VEEGSRGDGVSYGRTKYPYDKKLTRLLDGLKVRSAYGRKVHLVRRVRGGVVTSPGPVQFYCSSGSDGVRFTDDQVTCSSCVTVYQRSTSGSDAQSSR